VEGGARRAHLRRLQPGQPRPHDGGRLQPARAPRRDGRDPITWDELAGASTRPRSPCAPCRSASPRSATRGRTAAAPGTHRHAARVVAARPRRGLGELPFPPEFPKMPGEPPRVQPSRARKTD
jgi:hypothetical protein